MSLRKWNARSEPLNKFHSAIQCRTHGQLSRLSLDVIDGALVVEARTATYHTVQLALAAIEAFTADFPKLTPATISFRVNGQLLVLENSSPSVCEPPSETYDRLDSSDSKLPNRQYEEESTASLVFPSAVS